MRTLVLLAIVPTILAAAPGRIERVNFDLGAPSRQIAIAATEGLDTSIEASIRRDGALYDVRDWTVLLWYGTAATNPPLGLAFTNAASGRGWSRWDIDGAALATNGRFDVQIVASHSDGTVQEWARGYMTIRADSTSTFQPVTFGAPLHAVSNALAAAIAVASTNLQGAITAEAQARASGDAVSLTNWQAVVYSMTNGAALGATALQPSWAETGTVLRATEVIGAQSTLIETAWRNPAAAADWTWTSNGREITLTSYSGPNVVVIPDVLDGLPVTGFGGVFTGNMDITSVGGGANIQAVGDAAFVDCKALISVSLPACTTVGGAAFADCEALISVSLPACTTVGASAFAGGMSLISVSLPACITVGYSAFLGCVALNSVTFGQNAPAPAANVFEYSSPTIYVSNPHATGWGDTWNGRPVVRAASMPDIASATNALVQTYFLTTNAWMSISNQTLTIWRETNGVPAALWSSAESEGGGGVDPAFANAVWDALAGKADAAWGKYAPDGSANPDPAYMTYLNAPATMHASGYQWATYGAYSVMAESGAVAYESGADGTARWGLDLETNYVGFVRGGSVIVAAKAESINVIGGGTETGYAEILYPYTSGDFPSLWHAPALDVPFVLQEGVVWVDNQDGTATVTAPATAPKGYWYATTTSTYDVMFDIRPPARLTGGVIGATNAVPVVYDSTITVTSGSKTYRIPAQEVIP